MKKSIGFLVPVLAVSQSISITPHNPVVPVGSTITITADRPVLFNLSGSGSISNSTGLSTTYIAPSAAVPQHVMNGCMVLPSDSVFNTRIDNLPANSNSASWAALFTSIGFSVNYQWGTNVIDNSFPQRTFSFHYSTQLNGTPFPVLPLTTRKRETGSYSDDGNNDHHMLVLNRQSCQFFETYQDGGHTAACPSCTAASGWTYQSGSYKQPSSADGGGTTDAAGLPLAPLTLHLSEIKAGSVNHALRVTSCFGCIGTTGIWPATGSTGAQPSAAPMGARFRLKASFDISSYPPAAQVVLTALKRYGMFLCDIGMEGTITASSDVTEDPGITADLATIGASKISYTNLEVVDESSFMLSPDSSAVNPNNPYQKPANYALLTISDAKNGSNRVQIPIAIQPVTVGTPDPTSTVQAGTPGFPIPFWVNGTTNQNVIWSINPPVNAGTISNSGVYTAPQSVSSTIQGAITVTSVADPHASATVYMTIIPGGAIRIDTGSQSGSVDGSGNHWLPDLGFETGNYQVINDSWPTNGWGSIPDRYLWQTYIYTWGDDIFYRLHVPNGNYKVALMFGIGDVSGTYNTGLFDNGLFNGPVHLQAQNQIAYHNWDIGIPIKFQARTPETVYLPAKVTDTSLLMAIHAITNTKGHTLPRLSGIIIIPDSTAPHLTIDNQQITNLSPGSQLQLYATDWYFGNPAVSWRILNGIGSISSAGLYTAPANFPAGQTVSIEARANGSSAGASVFTLYVLPATNRQPVRDPR